MFYPNDFTIKKIKEQEIREWVEQAHKDRLLSEIRPHQPGMFQRLVEAMLHGIGHLLLGLGAFLNHVGTVKPKSMRPSAHH